MRSALRAAAIIALVLMTGMASRQAPTDGAPAARPPLVLLYDELPDAGLAAQAVSMRAFPYRIIYQSSDPEAGRTGRIDVTTLLQSIRKDAEMGLPDWGMLDFEDPFQQNLQKGPESDICQRTVRNMVEAMQAVRAAFPGTKWTFYGMPWMPYWLDWGEDWSSASADVKRKALERATRIYQPLVDAMDWVSPTIYPKYDPTMVPGVPAATVREQGRAWRSAQVGLARLLGRQKPVIPNVCPWWTPGGKAKFCTVVSPRQFLEDQVLPAVNMGASGFALWGSLGYTIRRITDPDQQKYSKEADFGTPEWRTAVTADYLGGKQPSDWSAPEVRERVSAGLCQTMVRAVSDIRAWEVNRTLPSEAAPRAVDSSPRQPPP